MEETDIINEERSSILHGLKVQVNPDMGLRMKMNIYPCFVCECNKSFL